MGAVPNSSSAYSKDAVAQALAKAHLGVEPAISGIYRIEAPNREALEAEPVKLLEVNPNTTASGIMPVYLSAHPASGIYYPSVVVEIHPSELDDIKSGKTPLPHGWKLDVAHPLHTRH